MSVELNPVGVACNIRCTYCYENPMRDAQNVNVPWDWEKARATLDKEGYFSLHGGEPLLAPIDRIEQIFDYGFKRHGYTGLQTNGTLITPAHIALFKKYRTQVGISTDGPGACSDSRWAGTEHDTRNQTEKTMAAIEALLSEGLFPSLIVTLWKGNCDQQRFRELVDWFIHLDSRGLRWVNLHYMEVDSVDAKPMRVIPKVLTSRMVQLYRLEQKLKCLRFENFKQYISLLRQNGDPTHCIWNACDPLTTAAVQGINGQGIKTNCNRTNKDGVDWTKADVAGHERQAALYHTPHQYGGCKDCRFFLMCKGECPGSGIRGDWRNRTEHCDTIFSLFSYFEAKLVALGETPTSLAPNRKELELRLLNNRIANIEHGDHTDARVQAYAGIRS